MVHASARFSAHLALVVAVGLAESGLQEEVAALVQAAVALVEMGVAATAAAVAASGAVEAAVAMAMALAEVELEGEVGASLGAGSLAHWARAGAQEQGVLVAKGKVGMEGAWYLAAKVGATGAVVVAARGLVAQQAVAAVAVRTVLGLVLPVVACWLEAGEKGACQKEAVV